MKRMFFLAFFIFIFQNVQAEKQKLSQAYEQGLLERVRNVFSLEAPEEKVERPVCATPIFVEINFNKHRFSAKTAQLLKTYVSRPDFEGEPEYIYDTPSEHFRIHYARTGTHAVFEPDVDINPKDQVPDYVNRCADIFDSVWTKEVHGLGYNPPPSDEWYQPNGGDGRYDIYLLNINEKYYGYTDPETSSVANPISYTSYIVVRNDYTGCVHEDNLDCLRATAAHEFFHAIQFGYDASEFEFEDPDDQDTYKPYWMEMSAVWMEDMVYDEVNDYVGYLSEFFNYPWLSLKTFRSNTDLHPYGSCVWPMYLQERFDTTIIRDIWEECAKVTGNNAIDYPGGESATDKALQDWGTTFEEVFREFTVWNYFTADRAQTQLFYSEGDLFPEVKIDSVHEDYPVSLTSPNHPPENLGSNYVVFVPDPNLTEGGISIDFDGHGYDYKVSAVGYNPLHLEPLDTTFLLNPVTMSGRAEVYNWNTYTDIVMIPAVTATSPDFPRIYEYEADYDSSLHGESTLPQEDEILQNYPNPFVIRTESDRTFFPFILFWPSRVRIDIFALSGERIKTIVPKRDVKLAIGRYLDQILAMRWDGKNEDGEYVSSGIYLYQFRTDRATVVRKMAVIR